MRKHKIINKWTKQIVLGAVAVSLIIGNFGIMSLADTTTTGTTQTTTIANTPEAQGMSHGKIAGTADGATDGRLDYLAGNKLNHKNTMMSDNDIIKKFNLNRDNSTYRAYFVKAYRDAYKIAYERAFRSTNLLESTKINTDGLQLGTTLGMASGASAAMDDFLLRLSNNPDRAFNKFTAIQPIEKRHRLDVESPEFRQNFVAGYEKGFKDAYVLSYRQRFAKNEVDNAQIYEISVAGEEVNRTWLVYDVKAQWPDSVEEEEEGDGGDGEDASIGTQKKKIKAEAKIVQRDNLICTMTIPGGAVYVPTHINVSGEIFSFGGDNQSYYSPASSVFNVRLWNYSDYAILRKPLKMSFNFVGSENAGIYRWQHGKWVYQPTEITEEGISTMIPAGKISSERYAIFIDDGYLPFKDTVFNWADPEIHAFLRRGHLFGGGNFRPDDEITRAEVAVMLYNVLGHRLEPKKVQSQLKDRSQFGYAADAIDFVVTNGIMMPYNGKFNPNGKFKYAHIEKLAPRITGNFHHWDDIAKDMMQERFYKSPGYRNPKANVTRAEMVYFLYHCIDK